MGATGTGKTAFALDLAEELGRRGRSAEIVNADAMQLYRGMDIGTAKVPEAERRGIPHHLFDELPVTAEASVEWYQRRARDVMASIQRRGSVALLVGGSGLYVSAAVFDFRFPGTDEALRRKYEAVFEKEGVGRLFALLRERDPAAAVAIGPHNGRRLVRALEVGEMTGAPFAVGLPEDAPTWNAPHFVGLSEDRSVLVDRLDARVDAMWRDGLLDEVRALLPNGLEQGVTASRAIGYAQAIAELRGDLTEDEAKEATRALTRRYARRQVSWFKRYPRVTWATASDPRAVSDAADRLLA
ncbi:tRNA (adenosine(37)-N6)-dimethylallyltransferase MiaA [Frondihabitans cladoniiphilus]|uniref:tRNA (adenosine(37)-N6)-dimethylallyltransferase MiaA n=1 Tax=Frondihabitans cladoniiphilus TaxID=715785 RepID=UPI0031EFBDF4